MLRSHSGVSSWFPMTLLLVAPLRLSSKKKRKDDTSSGLLSECERKVRKRTQANNLLHDKGNCCVPSIQARQLKILLYLPGSEGDLKAVAHSIASSSLRPDPLPLPLYPGELAHIQVPDECALLLAKTSHSL